MTIFLNRDPEEPAETEDQLYIGKCVKCAVQWQGQSLCHCTACHLTFTAIGGFDDHRTGSHANDTRHCRTEEQIRERGYEPNDAGYWRQPMTEQLQHWGKK